MTKEQRQEYNRRYRLEHIDKIREYSRRYMARLRKEHPERIAEYERRRNRDPDKVREQANKYYHEHKEERAAYHAKWYRENTEYEKARVKAWREQNREKVRETQRRYYERLKAERAGEEA